MLRLGLVVLAGEVESGIVGVDVVVNLSSMALNVRCEKMDSESHTSCEGGMLTTFAHGFLCSITMQKTSLLLCALVSRKVWKEELFANLLRW